ncbi:MAG: hypothetical protein CL843_09210 [Crocinitomicaceae bacterium]|nr:hypothetical protein [Crocinitomicaceae bacterium]|tara:strand:- start:1406 stop:2086 length:681 start_codon:yes stop_codon:yes gene_type:complete
MSKSIIWKPEERKLSDLKEWEENPRIISEEKFQNLVKQIRDKGFTTPILINTDNTIIAGHQRRNALIELGRLNDSVLVMVPSRKLTKKEFEELALGDNLNIGTFDIDQLQANFSLDVLLDVGFEEWEVGSLETDVFQIDNENSVDGDTIETEEQTNVSFTASQSKDHTSEDNVEGESIQRMPFEILLEVGFRKDFMDLLRSIKDENSFETTQEALFHLAEFYKANS